MTWSRRNFLKRSTVAAATLPLLEHLSFDYCAAAEASAGVGVDFSMGYPPGALRLNRNENPLGPSPKAVAAAKEGASGCNRYAFPPLLEKALAELHGITEDHILIGTGSSEILRLAPLALLRDGGNLVATRQAYRAASSYAERLGAPVHWVSLRSDWSYDVDGLLGAVDHRTKVLYLVNPNNPTGTSVSYEELQRIADTIPEHVLLLIDEAYVHFLPGDGRNGVDLVKAGHENVLVARTFSKVYGLAGLRLGYGVAHPDVISRLSELGGGALSLNIAAYGAAIAALDDDEHVTRVRDHARDSRKFFSEELSNLGLDYISGSGLFIMIELGDRTPRVYEELKKRKIWTRMGGDWDLVRHLRVSFGKHDENEALVHALREILA